MSSVGTERESRIINQTLEKRLIQRRLIIAFLMVMGLLSVLVYRYYTLQVVQHEDFVTQSDRNRIQAQPVAPTRGLIYDRNGELLADNRPSYRLSLVLERIDDLPQTIVELQKLVDISDVDIERFYKAKNRSRARFQPMPIKQNLTEAEIARISVHEHHLPGVEVEAELVRYYPHGALFAHTIGYVGRINERELANFDDDEKKEYSATYTIGKIGLENFYERALLGSVGTQLIETNAHGRSLRVLTRSDPVPGKNLYLSLDINLQKTAMEALGENRGAVVAIEVKTGSVLAMVSTPSFDPNLFVTGISNTDYIALNTSKDLPLYNRTIQAQYPPGSILKPMLGLGGLETGVITPQTRIFDPGWYQLGEGERFYRDWKKWGHGGAVDLNQAITESCDTFFYSMSIKMGIDAMHPFGSHFGLGQHTGIDLPNERKGLWPSREWKKATRRLPWYPGDSLNVSIGQGDVLVTPLQMAQMTATLANRGVRIKPHLVDRIDDEVVPPTPLDKVEAKTQNWNYIFEAMQAVIHSSHGTAKIINKDLNYRIAGKTGTAQVIGIAQNETYNRDKIKSHNWDHALFIAFAPADNPEIAVAIIVENGEHGSSAASPIARKVFDAWLLKDKTNTAVPTNSTAHRLSADVQP
jgi:penicillin-binding protein 2